MNQILIVEDDDHLGKSLQRNLENEGFVVRWVQTLELAKEAICDFYDVVILDWMLPDGQGIDFLKEIKNDGINSSVIMLTARTDLVDKVVGLESGANDYITKPFESRELVARIRVQLRSLGIIKSKDTRIVFGELTINSDKREIVFKGKRIDLTKMEYELLKLFAENPRQTFSRENLLDKVCGFENYPSTRTVDTHVLQLRQKFTSNIIETIRGVGYRLGTVK